MPSIGVAITTTKSRPDHYKYWHEVVLFSGLCDGMKVEFIHDVEGVAKAKNESLRKLQGCEYIFLFDDDTFPIKQGWAQFFIDAYNKIGCHHFTYLHPYLQIQKVATDKHGMSAYNNSAGCMMFMTKDIVERVGAFNESFGLYGYEHTEYSVRCKLAGLAPHHNVCPDGAEDYIYSMDLDSWMSFGFKHLPTIKAQTMNEAAKVSAKVFEQTINEPIVYLPL